MTEDERMTWWLPEVVRLAAGEPVDLFDDYSSGVADGAAVAFGLMGMAEAIRFTHLRIVDVSGWECLDECVKCGLRRCESEVPLVLKGDHYLCEVCNGE